jgi:hypothetical protein
MIDAVVWSVVVLLVSVGVAADGFLAWMFLRDWRAGRAEERSRRVGVRAARETSRASMRQGRMLTSIGLAALTMSAGAARAQEPVAPPPEGVSAEQIGPPDASPSGASPQPATTIPDQDISPHIGSAISVQLNLDFTNAYFYRGIRQQDRGLIVQPSARITTHLVEDDSFKLDGFIGTWNSFGPNAGTQTGTLIEDWYESDLYAGLALTYGKLSLATSYTFLTSPSDAFQTVQELGFTLALDDSEWMKAWALKPYATLALETGSNGSDGPDLDNGVYIELGIAPGFSFDMGKTPVMLTFPAAVGLSLTNYYQDSGAEDDTFGFAQVGAKASIPLGEPGRLGSWTLNAGVSVLYFGDHTKAFNNGDNMEVIGSVGLQWNF